MKRCEICDDSVDRCTCCLGCGHVCPLDVGEPYCPVCKPEPVQVTSRRRRQPLEEARAPLAGDDGGKIRNIHPGG